MDIGRLGGPYFPALGVRTGPLLDEKDRERARHYRATARKLRELAAAVRYDLRRRQQLLALAAGFDRAADRVDLSGVAVLIAFGARTGGRS